MNKKKLESTALRPRPQPKNGFSLVPKLVLLAAWSLYVASAPVTADPAVELPNAEDPGLDIEFRCAEGIVVPEGAEGGEGCPLNIFDHISFGNKRKYLSFEPLWDDGDQCYAPLSESELGIGAWCDESRPIGFGEKLRIEVRSHYGGVSSSTPMFGIYLNGLESSDVDGCFPITAGQVTVERTGGAPDLVIDWTADGIGGCDVEGSHAILVDFGGIQDVVAIEVDVDVDGVYAAGIATCESTGCEIELVENPLPGGDLRAIISDPGLIGAVGPADGFPLRVRDDRDACQWNADSSDIPEVLVFDGSLFSVNGNPLAPLKLVVSENTPGNEDYLTISAKGCGVLRKNDFGSNYLGDPVPRNTAGSNPYFDIIAIDSEIIPFAEVVGFESDGLNNTPYACEPDIDDRDLDQPFLEINARPDEIKYLAGLLDGAGLGIIDPVGRDIMVGCGSKRGSSRRFSYVAWNLIHASQTDMRAEIDDEITVLEETVERVRTCVDASFASRQLRWPRYIRRYYNSAVSAAESSNATRAAILFGRTAMLVDRFKVQLERPGVSDGFERCYASGSNLDKIIDAGGSPGATDVPLNAFGDLISQLEHLSYALESFVDELIAPPPP